MKTDAPKRGRYVCIEAIDALDSGDIASIAEFYVLGKNGERLSREPWTVIYADSEETGKGNHSADKIFDLQESTYWSSEAGNKYPHHIVIDLGSVQDISGIQYLPRMENNVPGGIKNFKFYIKESVPFKY